MPGVQDFAAPTTWEAIRRLGYRCAYRLALVWWFIRRPSTNGALVALWEGARVLLIRTSYRSNVTLPGGFVAPGESPRDAALRELREEVGLVLSPAALQAVWRGTIRFESRADTVSIFEVHLGASPTLLIDPAEVEWAGWFEPDEALRQPLLPHVRGYLRDRRSTPGPPLATTAPQP